jgi:hypothetical protein
MKDLHLGRLQMAALRRKNNSRFNRCAGTLAQRNRSAQLRENKLNKMLVLARCSAVVLLHCSRDARVTAYCNISTSERTPRFSQPNWSRL